MKARSKHIVIVTPYYAPAWAYGGPPRVLSTLAEELVKLGYKVSVLTTTSLGELVCREGVEDLHGVSVHRFSPLSNHLAYKTKIFFIPKFLTKSADVLKTADRVLFSDVRSFLSFPLVPFLKKQGTPYGVFLFGQVSRGKSLITPIKWLLDTILFQKYIRSATWLFAQTPHETQIVQEVFSVPQSRIRLSLLPMPQNPIQPRKNTFRSSLSLSQEDTILLFVGRLSSLKGVDLLINAVQPLLEEDPTLHLVIVGRDDGHLAALRKLVPDHLTKQFHFPGPLYNEAASSAYVESDCFVFTPRFFEETSTAALEALSFGKPVICTEQADIPFLKEYQAGYIIPNTPESIQKSIKKILKTRKHHSYDESTRKLIAEHYTAKKVTEKLLYDLKI